MTRLHLSGIEQQAVDGEVAALDVFLGIGGVADLVGMAAIGVDAVAAERGHLSHGVARRGIGRVLERRSLVEGFVGDQHHAEMRADGEGAREEIEDDVGCCGGGYVVVERGAAEEEIAHAAAGEVGLVALGAQGFDDAEGGFELARGRGHLVLLSSTSRPEMQVAASKLEVMQSGLILGIESSCDETAAAVVERGERTLSSVVASQIATHARYGGVVPELASREHLRAIVPVVRAALAEAGVTLDELDAIAVTAGPGLAGALLVGSPLPRRCACAGAAGDCGESSGGAYSRGAAAAARKQSVDRPAQDRAVRLERAGPGRFRRAHASLSGASRASAGWHYKLLGRTVDDAAGEAYDKVAKLLGFGYPGGPWIDALARFGNPRAVPFSFAQIKTKIHLQGQAPRTKGGEDSADCRPRSAFHVFVFGDQDGGAAACGAEWTARRREGADRGGAGGRAAAKDAGRGAGAMSAAGARPCWRASSTRWWAT